MEVTLDKKNNVTASITIKLTEADYGDNVKKSLKDYAKKANLKGFRPGKVPVGLIKKMYGKSVLVQEVTEMSGQKLQEYIKEEDLKLVAQPIFDEELTPVPDWDNDVDFSFSYEVGLEPVVDYEPVFSELSLTKREIEISEDDVNEYIENLQQYYGERPEIEQTEATDTLIGTFKQGEFAGQGFFKIADVAEGEQEKFIGVKKEDVIKFDLRTAFPDEEKLAEVMRNVDNVAELAGEFEFEVHNLTRTIAAEMDEKFFKSVFGEGKVENEEEFRAKVKESIEKYYNTQTRNLFVADFQKGATEKLTPEFPDAFLRKWLLTNDGITEDNVDENFKGLKDSVLWEITRNQANKAKELEEPTHEDLIAHLKNQFFMQYFQMNILNMDENIMGMLVQQYLGNQENQGQIMSDLNLLSTTRLLEKIEESLKVETVKMTRQEFEDYSKEQWEKMEAEKKAKEIAETETVEAEEVVEA